MLKRAYLGIDVGSISTKAVVISQEEQIVSEQYIWTEGNPVGAVKTVLAAIKDGITGYEITASGATGSARRLTGAFIGADVVKNEITAHAAGTLSRYPDTRTIFEIGGQDSKIILIEDGVVVDYAMNTLCAAGTGAFLSSQAVRLGTDAASLGELALKSASPARIAARCTVFAESDLVHKAQAGYKKEDIVAGLCFAVAGNFLNNLAKGKKICPPIVFQGGVSRNKGVVKAFGELTGQRITTDPKAHLFGALGAALLAKNAGSAKGFDFKVLDDAFETKGAECNSCENRCELVRVYRGKALLDTWGRRCEGQ